MLCRPVDLHVDMCELTVHLRIRRKKRRCMSYVCVCKYDDDVSSCGLV